MNQARKSLAHLIFTIVAMAMLLGLSPAYAEPCPSAGGDPCKAEGPTAKSSGLPTGALNPIDFATGAKYNRETDLAALPGVLGLELVRHYNHPSAFHGRVGANWSLSYEAYASITPTFIQIHQGDGKRRDFELDVRSAGHIPTPTLC